MAAREHQVLTPVGRRLRVLERGVPDGRAVLVHGGTPNSRLMFDPDVTCAERHGVRVISYDRPGYGGSSRREGRTVGDCAEDVRTIAQALAIRRLGVWGISGGGPHAIACAALLPDLVSAVAVVASSAPWQAEGLDYFAGMGELNVEDTQLILADPVAARARLEREREEVLELEPAQLLAFLESLLAPVDLAAASGELAEFLVTVNRSGLAPGCDGWWDDEVANLARWGFAFESIRVPVQLWHGRHDRFVPFAHGQWLARHIPAVDAHLSDDDGHLTLTRNHLDEIYDWLLDRTSRSFRRT